MKRKALDAAQKYVQKGAYDKALKEYERHLKAEPSDVNTRLKAGDLYLKKGDQATAIETYVHAAEQFSRKGFDAKAVAIYKQILKVDPGFLDARVALGDHFQRLGLVSDALREFQEAVNVCRERGLKREAFDMLKRVGSLDPGNVANRLNLADLLAREGMKEESESEYTSLLDELERGGSAHENMQRAAAQMLESFPESERALRALMASHVAQGDSERAASVGTEALSRFPDSIELRDALIEAHHHLGDTSSEQRVYRELAELYKRRGDPDKAREILQRFVPAEAFGDDEPESAPSLILDRRIDEFDSSDGLELDTEAKLKLEKPTEEPEAPPELEQLDALDDDAPAEDLMSEARVSFEFGDLEDARRRAEAALERDPTYEPARDLLAELDAEAGEGDGSAAKPVADEPSAAPGSSQTQEIEPFDSEDDTSTLPDIELVLEDELEIDDRVGAVEPVPEVEIDESEPTLPELESLELELDTLSEAPAAEPQVAELTLDEAVDPDASEPGSSSRARAESAGTADSWAAQSIRTVENMEEAEFFFEQGMFAEAEVAYRSVLGRVPNHPQALARLGELTLKKGGDPGVLPSADSADAYSAEPQESAPIDVPEVQPPPAVPALPDIGPDAVDLVDDVICADELLVEGEPDDESQANVVVEEPPATGKQDPDFDLAAALEDGGGERGTETAGFSQIFQSFKQGIQEQIGAEESEAHYDLAIAYKEMGLLEDAVEQLAPVCAQGDMRVEGLALLASCKLDMGRPKEAAGHLLQGLELAGDAHDCVVALRYDLAEAYLAAGQRTDAIDTFRKVAAADSTFRNVCERIADLSESKA